MEKDGRSRILCILKVLRERTDEEHPLSTAELERILRERNTGSKPTVSRSRRIFPRSARLDMILRRSVPLRTSITSRLGHSSYRS